MTAKQILGLHVIHHDGQLDGHSQQEPKSGASEVEAAQEMSKLSAMAQWFQRIGCSHNLSEPPTLNSVLDAWYPPCCDSKSYQPPKNSSSPFSCHLAANSARGELHLACP